MKRHQHWFEAATLWKMPGRIAVGLFGLPFLACGLFILCFLVVGPVGNWVRAQGWSECPARVSESRLATTPGDSESGPTYRVEVRYTYRWQGRAHQGDRFNFSTGSTNIGVRAMRAAVNRLPPGALTTCWVNPAQPAEAVLDRSWPPGTIIGLFFCLPFLVGGLIGFGGALFGPALARRVQAHLARYLAALIKRGEVSWPPGLPPNLWQQQETAIILSGTERLTRALGLSALNVFWNGIVAVFVAVLITEWSAGGRPPIFLALFLMPFVAVGLAMLWMCLRTWRAFFRPAWAALLAPLPNREGGEVQVSFAFPRFSLSRATQPVRAALVALAMPVDSESGRTVTSSHRVTGFRRRPRKNQQETELARVEIPELMSGLIQLQLPALPAFPPGSPNRRLAWWLECENEGGLVESFPVAEERAAENAG